MWENTAHSVVKRHSNVTVLYIVFFVCIIPARLFLHLLCRCFSLRSEEHTHTHTYTHVAALLPLWYCLFWFYYLVLDAAAVVKEPPNPPIHTCTYIFNKSYCWAGEIRRFSLCLNTYFLNYKLTDNTTPTTDTHTRSTVLRKCYFFKQMHRVTLNMLLHSHIIIFDFAKLYFSIFVFEEFVLFF